MEIRNLTTDFRGTERNDPYLRSAFQRDNQRELAHNYYFSAKFTYFGIYGYIPIYLAMKLLAIPLAVGTATLTQQQNPK